MKSTFRLILGCLMMVLFWLFTAPVHAQGNSPTQVFVEQAELSFDQFAPFAVLTLDASLSALSPQSVLEVTGYSGDSMDDWPPGSTDIQSIFIVQLPPNFDPFSDDLDRSRLWTMCKSFYVSAKLATVQTRLPTARHVLSDDFRSVEQTKSGRPPVLQLA